MVAQTSLYTGPVTRGVRPAAAFAAMLATVFGFYVLLGLETYALLVGAVALVMVLSIVLDVTQVATAGLRAPT